MPVRQGSFLAAAVIRALTTVSGRECFAYCGLADRFVLGREGFAYRLTTALPLLRLVDLLGCLGRCEDGVPVVIIRSTSELVADARNLLARVDHFLNSSCIIYERQCRWSALRTLESFDLLSSGPAQILQLLKMSKRAFTMSLDQVTRLEKALKVTADFLPLSEVFSDARAEVGAITIELRIT